ncbi:MAG TPA: hypothetical protein VIV11_39060 [Kofleriaceae bacterium]
MKRALVLVALLGCDKGQTDRERDCAKVRALFEPAPGTPPRRYRAEGDLLRQLELRDAEVRAAAGHVAIDTELLFLDAPDPRLAGYARLAKLCNLKPKPRE